MSRKTSIRTVLASCCGLLLAGCAALPPSPTAKGASSPPAADSASAIIHFRGQTDPGVAWMNQSATMQWGLLFTRDDLVVVKEGPRSTLINVPRYFEKEFLNRMATVKGIPNGEAKTFTIDPGTYDWLVLIDIQGDGIVDGFLGTEAAQGPLASFEFLPGKEYFIDVDRQGELAFRIEPDAAKPDDEADAVYLALMDSVADRLPEMDDTVLKEYVELVVEEMEALRVAKGDHCYELVQSNDRRAVARAYAALPSRLKVRESAVIDRVLRSPRDEREILSGEDAEEAMAPLAEQLRQVYGDDVAILDDEDLFAQNKELGCRIHRDLLALTLRMPLEAAAPLWRFMFSEEDDDDDEDDERPAVMNI